jgi:dienelactone hydrolase
MGALDDWTPVAQCQALFDRIATGRERLETHIYPGAHHGFDALGLPVRHLRASATAASPAAAEARTTAPTRRPGRRSWGM